MRRLPNDATGEEIAGYPASAASIRTRHVDLCWFLAHATFSFARGNCGLSWPITLLFGSKPPKTNAIKTVGRSRPIWAILGPVFLEVDYFLGSGE